jgi:hypothetical protein
MALIKHTGKYTSISNQLLNSINLSWKAKGLWAFINSKPDGWKFSQERISQQTKDGLESTRSGLKELQEAGYLVVTRKRQGDGQLDEAEYHLYEDPTYLGKSNVGSPKLGSPNAISNTDKRKKEVVRKNNKTTNPSESVSPPAVTHSEPQPNPEPATPTQPNTSQSDVKLKPTPDMGERRAGADLMIQNMLTPYGPFQVDYRHDYFPDLEEREIEQFVYAFMSDYPHAKPLSMANYLQEQNIKKLRLQKNGYNKSSQLDEEGQTMLNIVKAFEAQHQY